MTDLAGEHPGACALRRARSASARRSLMLAAEGLRLQAGLKSQVVQQGRFSEVCHRYLTGAMKAGPPANEVQQVVSVDAQARARARRRTCS